MENITSSRYGNYLLNEIDKAFTAKFPEEKPVRHDLIEYFNNTVIRSGMIRAESNLEDLLLCYMEKTPNVYFNMRYNFELSEKGQEAKVNFFII